MEMMDVDGTDDRLKRIEVGQTELLKSVSELTIAVALLNSTVVTYEKTVEKRESADTRNAEKQDEHSTRLVKLEGAVAFQAKLGWTLLTSVIIVLVGAVSIAIGVKS